MKRYLWFWTTITVVIILSIAVVNLLVDPYGLFRWVYADGFNAVKPSAGPHSATAKAYQISDVRPHALILGNSRAEVGFDPLNPAWPDGARPVFNLALPGTGPSTTRAYLAHAIAASAERHAGRIETVVWGVDFPDFLIDPDTPASGASVRIDRRLLVAPDGTPNRARLFQEARDYAEGTLTLGAFVDSLDTLNKQRNPYAANLTYLGFNTMNDYLKITSVEGYRVTFRQKAIDNTRAYLRRPTSIFDASGRSSPDLADLRQILALCRANGISLHLVIYPIHAQLLEIIRITGHWPAFETWKRAVTEVVADEAKAAGAEAFPLWDFSGFHRYATEAIPAPGDRRTKMNWYWEAGHFKRELGDLVLARVFGAPNADTDFGVRLDVGNVEAQLTQMRAEELAYRSRVPDEISALERIAADAKPHR